LPPGLYLFVIDGLPVDTKYLAPPFNDVFIRPSIDPVTRYLEDYMVVIAHNRVCNEIYRKNGGQLYQPIFNPMPAMCEVASAYLVFSAEKRPPDAAGNAMVVRRLIQADEPSPGDGHDCPRVR
jgi:hypothetical protein